MVHVHVHVGQHWQKAQAATATIACLSIQEHSYMKVLCVKQTQWFVIIILLLLLNSSNYYSDIEISERLHQLADGLPDQGISVY